jgi:hypothetical protein
MLIGIPSNFRVIDISMNIFVQTNSTVPGGLTSGLRKMMIAAAVHYTTTQLL